MEQLETMELDDFRVYLQGHLRDHHFPEASNENFINFRSDSAYNSYTAYRLEGHNVVVARELAMRVLLNGYYVSRWDVIYNLLDELFHNDLPEKYRNRTGQSCCSGYASSTKFLISMR